MKSFLLFVENCNMLLESKVNSRLIEYTLSTLGKLYDDASSKVNEDMW